MKDISTNYEGNGWDQYQKLVLSKLDDLNTNVSNIEIRLRSVETEIALLKLKSGMWGFIAGAIPVSLALVWEMVKRTH